MGCCIRTKRLRDTDMSMCSPLTVRRFRRSRLSSYSGNVASLGYLDHRSGFDFLVEGGSVLNFRNTISNDFPANALQNEQLSRLHFSAIILSFRDRRRDKFYPNPSRGCYVRLTPAMGSLLHGKRTQSGFLRAVDFPVSQQRGLLRFILGLRSKLGFLRSLCRSLRTSRSDASCSGFRNRPVNNFPLSLCQRKNFCNH